jgi:hypothetical protein
MNMDSMVKTEGASREAAHELQRISWKLDAIASLFTVEGRDANINLKGDDMFGFAFIIQDFSQEIKQIASRLEEGSADEE